MKNEIVNGADGALSAVIAMLWVFGLMACVVVTFAANRREHTMLTQVGNNDTLRMRVGVEIEVLRNDHSRDAPNQSIANWLDTMRSRHGHKFVEEYLATLKRRASEYRATRQHRRAALRQNLPAAFRANDGWSVANAGWSSGRTESYTKVTTDGSLNDGGFEVVSHPLLDGAHHGWLARMGTLLRHITRIDRSCGLHVHIGLRDPETQFGQDGQMDLKQAKAISGRCSWAYTYFGDVFDQFVSPSRHSATYCQRARFMRSEYPSAKPTEIVMSTEHVMHKHPSYEHEMYAPMGTHYRYVSVDEDDDEQGWFRQRVSQRTAVDYGADMYETALNGGRYYHCNVGSLINRPFGTVEYRQHQGTANPVKISYWIELMYQFTLACASEANFASIEAYPPTREGFWAYLDMASDDPIVDYYTKRASVLRNQPLIHGCPACGSHTCVHYECAGSNDLDIRSSFDALRAMYYRLDCCEENVDSSDIDMDDMVAYCRECEEVTDVTSYNSGLFASIALGFMVTAPLVGAVALIVGCGIGAMHSGKLRFNAKRSFKKLWSDLSSRGGQAAGFAWQKHTDDMVWHLKAPQSSVYLSEQVKKQLSKDTVWAMAHTRYATHGKNDSDNAHPHFGPTSEVTMVHNGVVHNHDDAWAALNIEPTGPVDSQAVAACLEVGGIEKVVELCQGSMSLIWSDDRDPKGTLKFWTNGGNPLCFGRLDNKTNGIVVVASTIEHLEDSQGKRLKASYSCTIGREYTIHPDGSITHQDIKGSEATAGVSYDWRTYASQFGTGKKTTKVKGKASGTADNCAINLETPKRGTDWQYEFDDLELNEAVNECWAANSISGFPPVDIYHGYNGNTHSGIRPDKSEYYLPHYYGMSALDPGHDTDQMVMLMLGDFDPQVEPESNYPDPLFDVAYEDWPLEWQY